MIDQSRPPIRILRRLPEAVGAVLMFGVVSAVFWGRFLEGRRALFHDTLLRVYFPYAAFFRRSILRWDFPFWNPHLFSGTPFLAAMQSALFYPGTYLYAALPFPSALLLNIYLHSVLAAMGAFLLGRETGLSRESSFLAGLIYGFNGFFVLHYALPTQFFSYAWLPLLWFLVRRAEGGSLRSLAGASLVLSLQVFAGHPQFTVYSGIALALDSLFRPGRKKSARTLVFVAGLAFLVTLPQSVPFLALAARSARAGLDYAWATSYSLSPREMARMLFVPLWNRWFVPSGGDPHIVGFYFGLPILALGVSAIGEGSRRWRPFFAVTAAGFLLALGRYLPGYRLLYGAFFIFREMRFPAQALFLSCCGLPFLAGLGLDRWVASVSVRRVILLLCALDLWAFSIGAVATVDRSLYEVETPTLRFLHSDAGFSRVMMSPRTRRFNGRWGDTVDDAWARYKDSALPNVGMAFGLYDADGYDEGLHLKAYDDVLGEIAKSPASPWLNALSLKYVLSFWDVPGLTLRKEASSVIGVFENPKALPRVRFVPFARRMERKGMLSYVASHADHDFSTETLLEGRAPVSEDSRAALGGGSAAILRYDPDLVVVSVDAPGPGWLVFSDGYDEGWTATVNGKPSPVERADYWQKSVPVGFGASVVEFRYCPRHFRTTAGLSLLTLLFLFSLLFWIGRRPGMQPS